MSRVGFFHERIIFLCISQLHRKGISEKWRWDRYVFMSLFESFLRDPKRSFMNFRSEIKFVSSITCHVINIYFAKAFQRNYSRIRRFQNSFIVLVSTLRRGIFTRLYLKYSTINNRVLNTRNIYNIFLTFLRFNFSIFPLQSQTFPVSIHVML
jgi:hypothetical protein